ncbi:hypothetical protein M9Y10_037307 [Tritrichomonas musculus]|uniref:Uncharacterized protein n=1 Tax=Tritrichomonas musculus TaxID=1915356 RepID=A0ABR2GSB1_9EUKA
MDIIPFFIANIMQIKYFSSFKSTQCLIRFQINPGFLDFGSFILTNISLGYNYQEDPPCYLDKNYLSYRPNRIWHRGSYSCLFGSLIWYPDSAIPSRVQYFLTFLSLMSINNYTNPNRNVYALMAFNSSTNTRSSLLLDQRIEKDPRFPGFISTLDDGYELFWFKGVNQRIPILYTEIKQRWFDKEFLESSHKTPNNYSFSGMYAAGTNFVCWAQANFRIFDYFDFWGKADADLRFQDLKFLEGGELIPLTSMSNGEITLMGCNHEIEPTKVCENLFTMCYEHFSNLDKKCGRKKHLKIRSIKNGYLFSRQQKIPGFFQIGWLGLFSSAEVKSFTESWFTYKEGIRKWRWGDQQYSLLVAALFDADPKKHIAIWPFERMCYPYSNKSGNPMRYMKSAKHDLKFIKKTKRVQERIFLNYVK